ncbi:hypothetical protein CAPTEDRAFT_193868 [Capitella teleta]|uniref:Uncharacterized protein n=1 Tax=Capitella teleta TaxID=283909 RepID=R7UYU6_CAPTE|nr:hypothetical protein CAPTEDRAFT_193868 [Capitella teleta]|eukprot:ELU11462.1 hypothetical protein CAPTEDRAFT_193868 [Capitella teleta]
MSLGATSTPPSGRSASLLLLLQVCRFDAFGDIMAPQANAGQPQNVPQPKKQSKVITGDLDSSLASLAGNLNMNSGANQIKKMDHQWTASPERKGLTGGQQWAQPGFTGSTFGSNSMNAPLSLSPSPSQFPAAQQGQGQMPGGFAQQPRMAQPMHPMGGMQPMPAMSMAGGGTQPGNPVQWNMMAGQPQHPQGFMAAQPQQMAGQPQQAPQPQHNDPFGAL